MLSTNWRLDEEGLVEEEDEMVFEGALEKSSLCSDI
jgi:hypothetical protein